MSEMDRLKLEELLSAYLDGELGSRETQLVERVLGEDESARCLLEDLRRTASLVSSLPRHDAPDSIAGDVQMQIERRELLGDLDVPISAPGTRRSRFPALLSMAAMLTLVIGGGVWIILSGKGPGIPKVGRVAMRPAETEEPEWPQGTVERHTVKRKEFPGRATEKGVAKSTGHKKRRKGMFKRARQQRSARGPGLAGPLAKGEADAMSIGEANVMSESMPPLRGRADEQLERKNLLATADIEQKLALGMDAGKLRDHRFRNETIRVRVTMPDEGKREELTSRLAGYLRSRRIADLSMAGENGRERRDPRGVFFYEGEPGVNFDDPTQRQILVRVRRRELEGLFDRMTDETVAAEDVVVLSGPSVATGLGEARDMLRYVGDGRPDVVSGREKLAVEGKSTTHRPGEEVPASTDEQRDQTVGAGGLLAEVMKAVTSGLSREPSPGDSPISLGPAAPAAEADAVGEASGVPDAKRPAAQEAQRESTLVEAAPLLGGVCLREGCIPSKALLHVAHLIGQAAEATAFGLSFGQPQIDLERLRSWKQSVVEKLSGGVNTLASKRNVRVVHGKAAFEDSRTLRIEGGEVSRLKFKHAIIATGSQPARLPESIIPRDCCFDSTGTLALPEIPETLAVIGGGYIGLELGQL